MKYTLLLSRCSTRLNVPLNLTKIFNKPFQKLDPPKRRIVGLTNYSRDLLFKTALGTVLGTVLGYAFLLKFKHKSHLNAASLQLKDIIEKSDELYKKLQFSEIYELLSLYKDSSNDDILWRLARAVYEEARKSNKTDVKKALYAEALECLQRAHSINEDNFNVHKWMVTVMDSYSSMEGMKARAPLVYVMKTHLERACELKPEDGDSWHTLGMWYYGIANISWYERKAASLFIATLPDATYQEALDMFIKAENAEPDFASKNYLMIGKCLYNLGRKEEAVVYFTKAKTFRGKALDDEDIKYKAEKWLQKA